MSVITISRQSGSDGNVVAELLCQKLNYRLFDKALMIQLAEKLNAQILDNEKFSEASTQKTLLERFLTPFNSAFEENHQPQKIISIEDDQTPSVSQIRALILAAYDQGNVVIVGRGSQIVLADKPDVLHVRVVAPLEKRIQAWQIREGLSYNDASQKINLRDKAHVDFVKNYFDTDLRNPALYDLIVNTQKLSPLSATDLIIQALHNIEPPG